MNESPKVHGVMRATGGTGYQTVVRGDWETVEREFKPVDLVNVLQCFKLSPEREEWVQKLLEKRLAEQAAEQPAEGCQR